MGFFFSMARFHYEKRRLFLSLAYIIPVILHGTYDFLLMYMNNLNGTDAEQEVDPMAGALYMVFLVFFFFVWRFAVKRVNKMSGQ